MREWSAKAARKPDKGGLPNVALRRRERRNAAGGTAWHRRRDLRHAAVGIADARPHPRRQRRARRASRRSRRDGASIRIVLNTRIFDDPVPIDVRDLPEVTPEYVSRTLVAAVRSARHPHRDAAAGWTPTRSPRSGRRGRSGCRIVRRRGRCSSRPSCAGRLDFIATVDPDTSHSSSEEMTHASRHRRYTHPAATPALSPDARVAARRGIVTAHRKRGRGLRRAAAVPERRLSLADPFLLLDHMGAVEYAPGEAKGTPWHPHRGFETVTYIIDGAFEHQDTTGGGGLITDGATQWMTAGAGILHIEMPPERLVAKGGLFHGVQLWVNLPAAQKWTPPRYQDIEARDVALLVERRRRRRWFASSRASSTATRARASPRRRSPTCTRRSRRARGCSCRGRATSTRSSTCSPGAATPGAEQRPLDEGQLAVFGDGDALTIRAADAAAGRRRRTAGRCWCSAACRSASRWRATARS